MLIQFTVSGSPPIIGNILQDTEEYLYVEYPIVFYKEDNYIYTVPYMPFTNNGFVTFSKELIIATADVHKEIEKHYYTVVRSYKNQKLNFKISSPEDEVKNTNSFSSLKLKTFH